MNTIFKSMEEIVEWFKKVPFNTQLSINTNTEEDEKNKNNGLWYGIIKSNSFDGKSFIFGKFGDGIIAAHYYIDDEDIIEIFQIFFEKEKNFGFSNTRTKICVDKEEWVTNQ